MRIFCLLLFLMTTAIESHAQDTIVAKRGKYPAKQPLPVYQPQKESKFYYGGYLNLTLGSYTAIGVEPLVAYKITPNFSAGAILTYEYIRDNGNTGYTYKSSNYGASIFSRYRVIPQFYLHAQFSEMKYNTNNSNSYNSHYWVPFLFLGGGYSQQISQNVWINTQILFDVIQNENSPYSNWEPFYSVGFGVGF